MADVAQLNARLAAALKARAELEAQLTLPEVLADHTALARIGRELSRTAPLAEAGEALTAARSDNKHSVLMRVKRGGSSRFVAVPLAKG